MAQEQDAQRLKEMILQLQCSGIQYFVEFVGSVAVNRSINSLPSERRDEVARGFIRFVVQHLLHSSTASQSADCGEDEHDLETYIGGPVEPRKGDVELNISSKAILVIDRGKVVHTFDFQHISLFFTGKDDLSSSFCFFVNVPGKQQPDKEAHHLTRMCFVFNGDSEVVRQTIGCAFLLNAHNRTIGPSAAAGQDTAGTSPDNLQPFDSAPERAGPLRQPADVSPEPRPGCSSALLVPDIRIQDAVQDTPPPPPPKPRRSLPGLGNGILLPGHRRAKSGVGSALGSISASPRSSSTSPRDDVSVQMTASRYKEIVQKLDKQSWYHGMLARLEADRLVRQDGQFLVRQSPNIADQFVLVGMRDQRVRHVCLLSNDGRIQTTIGDFTSIFQLISFFHRSQQPLLLHSEQLMLRSPVSREK